MLCYKKIILTFSLTGLSCCSLFAQTTAGGDVVQMIYTSDPHYGITRHHFRGDSNVVSAKVNAAMIREINRLPKQLIPVDSGVRGGQRVAYIDYLIEGGDIANRMESPVQPAAASWLQFRKDYSSDLRLKGADHRPARLLMLPGNHDITNAIGFGKTMQPATDPSTMVGIYNQMLKPEVLRTATTYNYKNDKVHYSFDLKDIHLMFVNLWPDSAERVWMEKDLANVPANHPVIIFTHDQPVCEAKHFTNPVYPYQIVAGSKFENLAAEHYKEAALLVGKGQSTDLEQRGLVAFLNYTRISKPIFMGTATLMNITNTRGLIMILTSMFFA